MTTRTTATALLLALAAATAAPIFDRALGIEPAGPPPPTGLPECRLADEPAKPTTYADWSRTILDTAHRLAPDYEPPDLHTIELPGGPVRLREFVVGDLRRMIEAAAADSVIIRVNSGYRSFAEQAELFRSAVDREGLEQALRSVARPGHSEHQLGTAVDLAGGADWLRRNSWRYGFLLSYPHSRSPQLTCYMAEPWHLRYFGRERAAAIHHSGLSPREWLWLRQQTTSDVATESVAYTGAWR